MVEVVVVGRAGFVPGGVFRVAAPAATGASRRLARMQAEKMGPRAGFPDMVIFQVINYKYKIKGSQGLSAHIGDKIQPLAGGQHPALLSVIFYLSNKQPDYEISWRKIGLSK